MKGYFRNILLILTLTSTLQVLAQDSTTFASLQSVKINLCHKWKPTTGVESGRKYIVTKATIIEFREDGTFIDSIQGLKGKWTYNPTPKTLEMIDKAGKTSAKLVELTYNILVLNFNDFEAIGRVTYTKID